jgi:hypothetical protein
MPVSVSPWKARSAWPLTPVTILFTIKPEPRSAARFPFAFRLGVPMIDLDEIKIRKTLNGYLKGRAPQTRDASWGYCFNFFQERREGGTLTDLLPGRPDHELGCLQLASYLASWGMYRGSGPLLQRSAVQYGPVLEAIVAAEDDIWVLDADVFDKTCWKLLESEASQIRVALDEWPVKGKKRVSETVKTKIMLGVYGCVPAFDEYVRECVGGFCKNNIVKIGKFCTDHQREIAIAMSQANLETFEFSGYPTSAKTQRVWTMAKVVDALLFASGGGSSD